MREILEGCKRLRVFVCLGLTPELDAQEDTRAFDSRVVACGYNTWGEAAAPAGQRTFWDVAEEFLERKRKGEVKGTPA